MKYEKQLTRKLSELYKKGTCKHGILHNHIYSLDDSFQSPQSALTRAAELNAPAIASSDHGQCYGWDPMDDEAKKNFPNIKIIFGVEFYLQNELGNATHMVAYAKNNEGMRKIQLALSRGEVVSYGGDYITTISEDVLREYLSGGDIIATSACISGVFGGIVLWNHRLGKKIEKLNAEIEECAAVVAAYNKASQEYNEADDRMCVLRAEVSEAKAAAKKSFTGKQKQLDSMKKKLDKAIAAFEKFIQDGTEKTAKSVRVALAQLEVVVEDCDMFQDGIEEAQTKFNQRTAQLKSEIAHTQEVAEQLAEKTALFEASKLARAEAKARLDALAKDVAKVNNKKEKVAELEAQKLSANRSKEILDHRIALMKEVFGNDFYAEVQNHGIDVEQIIYPWVAKVARKHHIPLIAANDSHVSYNKQECFDGRQIRRSCRFKKWDTEIEGDEELYIKDDYELALALYQILPEDMVVEAMENVGKIVAQCNATIDKGSHAPKVKGDVDVQTMLRDLAVAGIHKYGNEWSQKHQDRLDYELNIINSMGFNDYFVITWDIINFARQVGGLSYEKLEELISKMKDMTMDEFMAFVQEFNTEVNISVGLGRGSGAGSIVCYLLGITNIDPFKYDLLFERKIDCVH